RARSWRTRSPPRPRLDSHQPTRVPRVFASVRAVIAPAREQHEPPVFADPAGRRARWLRVGAAFAAVAGVGVLVALVLGGIGLGGLPGLSLVFGGEQPAPPVRTPPPAPAATRVAARTGCAALTAGEPAPDRPCAARARTA